MRLIRHAHVALLLSAVGCSDRAGTGSAGEPGGTIVIATPGSDVSSMLPPYIVDATGRQVADQIYERLAEIGDDLNAIGDRGFQPRLAKSWQWSADSMSIAFSIDPNATWHDGRRVRAADVKFTFDFNKDPRSASIVTSLIPNIDSVTARDSLTAVAWFHRRSPEQFYDVTYQLYVLPEHILKDIPRDKVATSEVVKRPVGTGRFRFVQLQPGVRIEIVADTGNYRGRPKLDRVIWAFSSDGPAAMAQLFSGQADLYENVPAPILPRIDSAGSLKVVPYPGLAYSFMGMNLRDPKRPATPHPIFGDVRVRRAISMALDRQAMLRNVFDTLGVLGSVGYPRTLGDATVAPPPFDRAHAAALLDSAGWLAGPGGQRAKSGRPLAFTLAVPNSSPPRMRYAVLIQEQLKSIGARVELEPLEFNAFYNRQDARALDAGMMSLGSDPSRSGIRQNWSTESMAKGGGNYLSYSSRTFDALTDSALSALDPARVNQYYHHAVQTLADDAPAVWLYDVLTIAAMHKRLRPARMRADTWWAHVADWSIPVNERIDRDRIGLRPAQP